MYSEEDINSAIAAGVLSQETASDFRTHVAALRSIPRGAEENFRLINSFNDIFVAIGIVILLIAMGAIGQASAGLLVAVPANPYANWDWTSGTGPDFESAEYLAYRAAQDLKNALGVCFAGLFVSLTAWPLAEFFTKKRRMALPSILLLLAFVGGVLVAVASTGAAFGFNGDQPLGAAIVAIAGVVAGGAAYLHWRRFQVPITVAAGIAALVIAVLFVLLAITQIESSSFGFLVAILIAGLGVFAFAMRWDISDRERLTKRSDVAFWLHLLAAPMIAHPIFALLGVTEGDNLGVGAAFGVLGVYIAFALLALAIDRRALLVSALAYVLFALTFLFREFGAVELNFALTALVIGSALLSLSAFWQPIRRAVVDALPAQLHDKLPITGEPAKPLAA